MILITPDSSEGASDAMSRCTWVNLGRYSEALDHAMRVDQLIRRTWNETTV